MKAPIAEDGNPPIVFLDIDDVLCLSDPYGGADALDAVAGKHAAPESVLREIFAAEPKRVLDRVHKEMGGRLRFVISSSWREAFSQEQIEQIFKAADLGFVAACLHAVWATPSQLPRLDRLTEIELWLQRHHRNEPFVVLDDDYSGGSLIGIDAGDAHTFASRVVLCAVGVGLAAEHLPMIVDALRCPLPNSRLSRTTSETTRAITGRRLPPHLKEM